MRVPLGSADGPLRLVYELEHESLAEIRNATVHAFVCMALVPRAAWMTAYPEG